MGLVIRVQSCFLFRGRLEDRLGMEVGNFTPIDTSVIVVNITVLLAVTQESFDKNRYSHVFGKSCVKGLSIIVFRLIV